MYPKARLHRTACKYFLMQRIFSTNSVLFIKFYLLKLTPSPFLQLLEKHFRFILFPQFSLFSVSEVLFRETWNFQKVSVSSRQVCNNLHSCSNTHTPWGTAFINHIDFESTNPNTQSPEQVQVSAGPWPQQSSMVIFYSSEFSTFFLINTPPLITLLELLSWAS